MAEAPWPEVGEEPFQPRDNEFPKRSYGVKVIVFRRFQPEWFDQFPWLHWDVGCEKVFCYACVRASRQNLISSGNADSAFISTGFQNWKEAKRVMTGHAVSGCHREAVERLQQIPQAVGDVGELLDSQLAKQRQQHRQCFFKILRALKFLARQGLPLRGATKEDGEVDGHFMQLLAMFAESDDHLVRWLDRRSEKYTSPQIQNEILQLMAHRVLRQVAADIRSNFFSVMVDETTDCSTVEQCVVVIRWVDDTLQPHEDFIGFYAIPVANADTIVKVIHDCLLRIGLSLVDCRGSVLRWGCCNEGCKEWCRTADLIGAAKGTVYALLWAFIEPCLSGYGS